MKEKFNLNPPRESESVNFENGRNPNRNANDRFGVYEGFNLDPCFNHGASFDGASKNCNVDASVAHERNAVGVSGLPPNHKIATKRM